MRVASFFFLMLAARAVYAAYELIAGREQPFDWGYAVGASIPALLLILVAWFCWAFANKRRRDWDTFHAEQAKRQVEHDSFEAAVDEKPDAPSNAPDAGDPRDS